LKIIALNLPRELDKTQFKELFANFGRVDNCSIVLDKQTGKSKGFGFIEMSEETKALKAVEELHRTKVLKNKIRVKCVKN
jgi:RNA recognition motif-containing protein